MYYEKYRAESSGVVMGAVQELRTHPCQVSSVFEKLRDSTKWIRSAQSDGEHEI